MVKEQWKKKMNRLEKTEKMEEKVLFRLVRENGSENNRNEEFRQLDES